MVCFAKRANFLRPTAPRQANSMQAWTAENDQQPGRGYHWREVLAVRQTLVQSARVVPAHAAVKPWRHRPLSPVDSAPTRSSQRLGLACR